MLYTLLIYRSQTDPPNELPPDEEEALLKRHRQLQEQTLARDELLAVARLHDPPRAKTVRAREQVGTTDGPYIETKEWLVGFYLLECEDEATALERARLICPEHGDHNIEVRPVSWHQVK